MPKKKEKESLQNNKSEEELLEEEETLAFSVSSEDEDEEEEEIREERLNPGDAKPPPVVVQLQQKQAKPRSTKNQSKQSYEKEKQIRVEEAKRSFLSDMGLSEYESLNFKVHVYRISPEFWIDEETGEEFEISGYLGESSEPVSPEFLKERYGQGTYKVRVWGPNSTGGSSMIAEKKMSVSSGVPNLYHLPTDEPMEQRRQEQAARQARVGGRPRMSPKNQEPNVSETLVDKTTGVLEGQVRALRQREMELLGRLDEKDREHKKELDQLRESIEELRKLQSTQRATIDPIHQKLIDKSLRDNPTHQQSSVADMIEIAKSMRPDLSGVTQSINLMTESVKQQVQAFQSTMSNQFTQTTEFLKQQMEANSKSFEERMEFQKKQSEWMQEQMNKALESKQGAANPRDELKATLGLLTDVLELKKTLVGGDDDDEKDDKDSGESSDSPWWADKLVEVFGQAMYQTGPAISKALGVPESIIKEQIRHSTYVAGELQPADMSEEELHQNNQSGGRATGTEEQTGEQEMSAEEVKLMSLVAHMDEAIAEEKPPEQAAKEVYPLLKPFIQQFPAMLQASPDLMWSQMKKYIADDAPFCSDTGKKYVADALEVVKKIYLNDNEEKGGE